MINDAGEGKVTCGNCSSVVVPRLWHHRNNELIRGRLTEHICPICGITMYETGGEKKKGVWLWVGVICIYFAFGLMENLLSKLGVSNDYAPWLSFVIFISPIAFVFFKRRALFDKLFDTLKKLLSE